MAERIVSLLPSATETLFALDLGDRVRAVSHACDHPPEATERPAATRLRVDLGDGSSRAIDDAVRAASDGDEPVFEVLEEVIHHADPDLIVTQDACSVCGVTPVAVRGALSRIEPADWPEILSLHPHTLADAIEDIERVADAAGEPSRGQRLADELRERVDAVTAAVGESGERPRVAVLDWLDPPMLAGHWIPGMVETAGGEAVLIEVGEPSRYVDPDELVQASPDVLVLAPCGFDVQRTREELDQLRERSWFTELVEQATGSVHVVNADAFTSRPGPRLVHGLEALAETIDPGLLGAEANRGLVTLEQKR